MFRRKKPVFGAEQYETPSRTLSFLKFFRPPIWLVFVAAIAIYIWIKGWPSVLWEYEFQPIGAERYKTACYYWNPVDKVHWQPPVNGDCPFIIGGRNANDR
ncbi:MAG: hypothetical protein ABJH52_17260 [Henriciella sp.]